ncbi:MAG: type VI secretion system baseplate subunit TssF [Spirosomataceae bacterium]
MYNEPQRYKTREYIRTEMIREIARLWQYDESDLAVESFDPLVGMLLGAFATSLENVHHELDNSRSRVVQRLAQLLTPEVLTGPQPAHALMKVGIIDPSFDVLPQHPFTLNAAGKELYFSSVGQYTLHNAKLNTVILQSRIRDMGMGGAPREYFMDRALPLDEVWIGLAVNEDLEELNDLALFFDWRNDPARMTHLSRLQDVRMFTDTEELSVVHGLVNKKNVDVLADALGASERIDRTVQRQYNAHVLSLSNRNRQTGQTIPLQSQKKKYPEAIVDFLRPDELQRYFLQDLFWIKIKFPGALSPEVLSRMYLDLNAFPVVNRRAINNFQELRSMFNVFPVRTEEGDFFLDMIEIETPTGVKLANVQQFNRDNNNQYLLRQGGVARFDERDASEMLSYLVDLLRDEGAMFVALGRGEIESDVEEIRKRLERISNIVKKDNFQNWFISAKTTEKSGRLNVRYWTTKADAANNLAFGTKLMRDRTNIAFTDDMTMFLTTTKGGQRPLQGDDNLPVFKKAILTRGRAVTPEDYKAVCFAELGDKLKKVEISKGFTMGASQYQGLQRTLDVNLIPNPAKPLPTEQWSEYRQRIKHLLDEQSSGVLPIRVLVNGKDE